jgi:hypothetical protein
MPKKVIPLLQVRVSLKNRLAKENTPFVKGKPRFARDVKNYFIISNIIAYLAAVAVGSDSANSNY